MDNLSAGDRVIIIISDPYLRSYNCMYELIWVWWNSKRNKDIFRTRIRPFVLPCALIFDEVKRHNYRKHWHKKYHELKDNDIVPTKEASEKIGFMEKFATEIEEVLEIIRDMNVTNDSDEFLLYAIN